MLSTLSRRYCPRDCFLHFYDESSWGASIGIALPIDTAHELPRGRRMLSVALDFFFLGDGRMLTLVTGLYTDESPGLKVDPVVVLVLSLVFIFSVVALHSTSCCEHVSMFGQKLTWRCSYCQDYPKILELNAEPRCTVNNRGRSVDTKYGIREMDVHVLLSA